MTFRFARLALVARSSRALAGLGVSVLFGLTLAAAAGCREQEDIVTRTEPHITGLLAVDRRAEPEVPASVGVPGRLIGVALPHGDATWFFKVLGPDEAVARQVSNVKALLATVRFENNQPRWDLPAGWRLGPDNPNRYATLLLDDASPPLELAVSVLAGNQNMADNVNRWRGQVGLAKQPADEAEKAALPLATRDGEARYVELQGKYSPAAAAMPPLAAAGAKPGELPAGHPQIEMPKGVGAAPAAATGTPDGRLKYKLPAEWTAGPPSGFVLAAFAVADGDEKLRITVSEAQGSLLDNINRWRAQELKLPPIDEDQVKTALTRIKVDGRDADYVELIGPANPGPQQAIFGVIIPQQADTSWFIKLKGDAPLAQRRREQFSQFLSSIRIAQ